MGKFWSTTHVTELQLIASWGPMKRRWAPLHRHRAMGELCWLREFYLIPLPVFLKRHIFSGNEVFRHCYWLI